MQFPYIQFKFFYIDHHLLHFGPVRLNRSSTFGMNPLVGPVDSHTKQAKTCPSHSTLHHICEFKIGKNSKQKQKRVPSFINFFFPP